MSPFVEIAAGVAIVGYVIGRQLVGEPLRGKRLVLLPVVLTVIGLADVVGDKVRPVDIAVLAVGSVVVVGIGIGQGMAMRLEAHAGSLWGQLPVKGLWLWLLLIGCRVLMTLIAAGLDAKVAAGSSTIVLMLGLNRFAQAGVVTARAWSAGIPFAAEKDGRVFLGGLTTQGGTDPTSPAWGRPRQ